MATLARNQTTRPAAVIAARFAGSRTAPPPAAITDGDGAATASARIADSTARTFSSPSADQISAIVLPVVAAISSSVSRNRRPSSAARRRPATDLPAPIIPTSTMWPRSLRTRAVIGARTPADRFPPAADGVEPSAATKPSRLRTSSATESPPNLRSASEASTNATIASATTPIAGTAVTSVRSLNESVPCFVATSTVASTGRLSVASGFITARTTSRPPVEIPPSIPPARLVSRR